MLCLKLAKSVRGTSKALQWQLVPISLPLTLFWGNIRRDIWDHISLNLNLTCMFFCFSTSNGDMIYRHMHIHDCVQSCHSDDLINLLLIWLFLPTARSYQQLELGCAGGFPTGNWWEGSRDLFTLRPYLDMAYNWDILCWKKYNFWTFTGNKSIPKLKDVFRWN